METAAGGRKRTGTPFAKLFTRVLKAWSGRDCATSMQNCTKRSTCGSWTTIARRTLFGCQETQGQMGKRTAIGCGERQIVSRATVRQTLWEAHMQIPAAVLEEALRRTEAGAERTQSSTAGRK